MRIADLLTPSHPCFSFEFFPPKSPKATDDLLSTIGELRDLEPTFVSVTYGAGGSTRDLTRDLVRRIRREVGLETMAHVTCVGHSRDELARILDEHRDAGVENVITLRGDPPRGETTFRPAPDGFGHASDLVAFVRARGYPFCLAAACYPEGHIECPDRTLDLEHLRTKVRAGVDFLITQLFFDNAFYFDFVARARAAGIDVPIVPGIMPITNVDQVERFTRLCGATLPMRVALQLERRRADPEAVAELGVALATLQCAELLDRGAPGIHFYTLNKSPATRMILTALRARSHG
jgi:methylenetetrahydrofolate reductase (NADPH)